LPTNLQHFMQKVLTEVKIFQKSFRVATFLKHPVYRVTTVTNTTLGDGSTPPAAKNSSRTSPIFVCRQVNYSTAYLRLCMAHLLCGRRSQSSLARDAGVQSSLARSGLRRVYRLCKERLHCSVCHAISLSATR